LLAAANRADLDVDSLDLFGLSHFLQRRGDADRAHAACSHALDLGLPAEFRPRARRELALLAKRRGEHKQAALLWHELAAEVSLSNEDSIHACEQLALYYERRLKDLPRAMEFARLALARVRGLCASSRASYAASRIARLEHRFLNRVARLQHRMALSGRGPTLPLLETRSAAPVLGKRTPGATASRKLRF
jgi:hypothetical protein